ncbi:MAG: hypothetical protein ABIR87_00790 [Sphingomicrobium sp.]
MLYLILVALTAAATPPPADPAVAPTSRRVCHDVAVSNSRFTRRSCSVVVDRPAATAQVAAAAATPVATTLGVGMAVVDAQGGAVGTITALAGDSVTVTTDKHQAQLPKSSLTLSDGKALFGLTRAQLNASVEQSQAATAMAALKVGAPVRGTGGSSVGTIDAVDPASVTIRLANGQRISIPRSGIAPAADGGGTIGLTAAELEAQLKAAQPTH